jgi:eukaryotic-like serine/threonine-protein kinase
VVLKGSLLGLASAHQLGIVHRDYKPENVLVDGVGDSKLTDFGVAVQAGKKAPAAGTPLYMAPEQWNGAPATPATDIYAATAVFFECLTGKTPFSGRLGQLAMQHETAAVPIGMVEEPLQQLIERGMAKDPRDRPPNAMEFVGELNWVAERAYGPDWEERGRSELGRRAAALILLLLGGAVAGAAGGSFTASALAALSRRKKVVLAGVAVGVLVAIAAAGTTLALQGNNTNTVTTAGSNGPGGSGGGGADGSGNSTGSSSTTPGTTPSSSASTSASPTPSNSAATTTPAGTPTTTPAGTPTTTPAGNPTTTSPATTPPAVITLSISSKPGSPVSVACGSQQSVTFTVTGAIHSTQATTVAYKWSSSGKSASASLAKGGSATVTDTVTLPVGTKPSTSNGSDILSVSSPSSVSASVPLSVSCTFPPLQIVSLSPSSGTYLAQYSGQLNAQGGDGNYTWSVTSTLPTRLSWNSGGVISGLISVKPGQYSISVTVTDGEGKSTSSTVTLTVDQPPPTG